MFTDWMMTRRAEVDYSNRVADDFDAWLAAWTWIWKYKAEVGKSVKSSLRPQVENKATASQGVKSPSLSARELYILSITKPVSSSSQDSTESLSSSLSPTFSFSSSSSSSPSSSLSSSSSPSLPSSFPSPSPPSHAPNLPAETLFKTEFFEVRLSPKGGYGAFAIKDIPKNVVVMTEEALFAGTLVEVFHHFEQLSREQRNEYMKLHAHREFGTHKILSIFKTNRFEVHCSEGGIFLKCSRLNHACHPWANCTYEVIERKCLKVTALFDIAKGQELTISYTTIPRDLPRDYGFYCDCPSCPPPKVVEERAKILREPNGPVHDWFNY